MFINNQKSIALLRTAWHEQCCKNNNCVFDSFEVLINPKNKDLVYVNYTRTIRKTYESNEPYMLINHHDVFDADTYRLQVYPIFKTIIDKHIFLATLTKIH